MLRSGLLRATKAATQSRFISAAMAESSTPVEDLIRERIKSNLGDDAIIIPRNDSHKHAHHVAMEGSTSKETHFHLTIVSDAFKSMGQLKRHRMIYGLFDDQMKREGGIHAMQLETRTPEEYKSKQGN